MAAVLVTTPVTILTAIPASVPVAVPITFSIGAIMAGGIATGAPMDMARKRRSNPSITGAVTERSGVAELSVRVAPDRHATGWSVRSISAAGAVSHDDSREGQADQSDQQR